MIIIPERQLVLITPPRTGSTSLLCACQAKYPFTMSVYRHMERDGTPDGYDTWETWGVMRHPQHRLMSLYRYCCAVAHNRGGDWARVISGEAMQSFDDWLINGQTPFTHPHWFLMTPFDPRYYVKHSMPEQRKSLWWYLRPDLGTTIVRLEDDDEMLTLRARLGIGDLGHYNVTNDKRPPFTLSTLMDHLERHFEWDLQQYRKDY